MDSNNSLRIATGEQETTSMHKTKTMILRDECRIRTKFVPKEQILSFTHLSYKKLCNGQ